MRNIYLHGSLGDKYGRRFKLAVETAGEAIRALSANFPGFARDLYDGAWHVVRGTAKKGVALDERDVGGLRLGKGDLHFYPVVAGSKNNGGFLKVILGAALVGAAFAFSGGALLTPIAGGAMFGATYGNMAMLGVAVALSGVSSLLSSEEKGKQENENSFTMNGPGTSYNQGLPVSLCYGEGLFSTHMISGGVDIENLLGGGKTVGSKGGKK